MKNFIEVHEVHNFEFADDKGNEWHEVKEGKPKLMHTDTIHCVYPNDDEPNHAIIENYDNVIYVYESYDEIKQMIKEASK